VKIFFNAAVLTHQKKNATGKGTLFLQYISPECSLFNMAVKITIRCYMYFHLIFHPVVTFNGMSKSEHLEICVALLFLQILSHRKLESSMSLWFGGGGGGGGKGSVFWKGSNRF
jgi:hypothetical protein